MLTSLNSVKDKLTGFDCEADDYVKKLFSFQELFARIKALIRRNKESVVTPVLKAPILNWIIRTEGRII
jgi:DNA-binding response OmpR family regulator